MRVARTVRRSRDARVSLHCRFSSLRFFSFFSRRRRLPLLLLLPLLPLLLLLLLLPPPPLPCSSFGSPALLDAAAAAGSDMRAAPARRREALSGRDARFCPTSPHVTPCKLGKLWRPSEITVTPASALPQAPTGRSQPLPFVPMSVMGSMSNMLTSLFASEEEEGAPMAAAFPPPQVAGSVLQPHRLSGCPPCQTQAEDGRSVAQPQARSGAEVGLRSARWPT